MDCADEAALIRRALDRPGVTGLQFDLVGRRVTVSYNASLISPHVIVDAVTGTGLGAHTHAEGEHVHDDHAAHGHRHGRGDGARVWALGSGALIACGWAVDAWYADSWTGALFGHSHLAGDVHAYPAAAVALYGASIITGLWTMAPRAVTALRYRRLDMHVLVCLSAVGAAAVGQWAEGAAVAFLFALAHLMEAWSIERARLAVADLVGHEPGWDDKGATSADVERFVERFAALYTPVVTVSALLVVLLPPLVEGHWGAWFYRGLIFLVLACPCALVISTPVTVVAAVTSAARRGVLFRGGLALERAAGDAAGALRRGDVVLMPRAEAAGEHGFVAAHAKRALRVIRQNVGLAIATKIAFLISALFGAAPLWLAVVADTGATVTVTLNGLRLLRAK
jgi:cation transport ATPase